MSVEELIQWCREEARRRGWVEFPEDVLRSLTVEQARQVANVLQSTTLMRLPSWEIRFFEWLREVDPRVWHDLWGSPEEEPYVVGLSFLPFLIQHPRRGFPICDLRTVDNYYFTAAHITPVEGLSVLQAAQQLLLEGRPLTLAQEFLLEVSVAPIDIWHFAYYRRASPAEVKEAVMELVEAKALIHLRSAEEVAEYVKLE
ncbi:MAG: hypothetical protein ABDH31_04895 [Chlorobiota bacterium]